MEEANKDAAKQYLSKARNAWRDGDIEKAKKFVNKSISLSPTEEAEEFLNRVKLSGASASNGSPPSPGKPRQRATAKTQDKKDQEENPEKREYTADQENAVKRVLKHKDFYDILELPKTASETEIKKQYRKLALQLHPDKNSAPKAEEAFKAVSKAYATLSDKEKKEHYDRFGEDVGPTTRGPEYREFDADEMFRMFFGDSVFGSGFGTAYRDPFGRRIYRTRSHSRYGHTHGHTHGPHQEADSGLAMFCQLVPIMILLLVVVFGNTLSGLYPMNSYSMYQSNYYPIKKFTKVLNIPYFVQESFKKDVMTTPSLLKSVENNVISEYMWSLNQQCNYDKYSTRRRGKSQPETCKKYEEYRQKLSKAKSS